VVDIVDVNMALIGDPSEYCVQCVMIDISTACGNYINADPAILIYLHLEKVGDSWKLSYKHT
jgi:hypothetical protein